MSSYEFAIFKEAVDLDITSTFNDNINAADEVWRYTSDYALSLGKSSIVYWIHKYKGLGPTWRGAWYAMNSDDTALNLFLRHNYPNIFGSIHSKIKA